MFSRSACADSLILAADVFRGGGILAIESESHVHTQQDRQKTTDNSIFLSTIASDSNAATLSITIR